METSQQSESKAHQSVLHQFFIKRSSAVTKESMCQDASSAAFSSTHEEVWTVKQQAIEAEIIVTLQFASQNMPFSAAESLAMYYQQQFPDSVIAKSGNWSKQDALCGGLWLKTLIYRYDNQGAYGRTIIFHTAL